MSDDRVKVTVSYGGRERRIPLAVKPGLELSDEQVEFAESDLTKIVRHVFRVAPEFRVDLHETEGGRIMTKESFRDPSYLPDFPRHWYLSTEAIFGSQNVPPSTTTEVLEDDLEEKPSQSNGTEFAPLETVAMETADEPLVSLAELSYSEMKYQSISVHCDALGQFGFSLRHFTIQPSNIPRSATPEGSRSDSRCSMRSTDSLDTLRLSTSFVHCLEDGGPAIQAGLKTGDVVHMINDIGIIRSGVDEVEELLQQCGDDLCLLVLPRDNDDLQFLYPQYTYGPAGEHDTPDGRVAAYDLPVIVGTESEILDCKKPSFSGHLVHVASPVNGVMTNSVENLNASEGGKEDLDKLGSPPHGLIPFNGSAQSLDHSSNDNDILITGSLSEIPIALGPTRECAWDGLPDVQHEVSSQGLQHAPSSHDSLPGLQQLAELSPTWQNSSGQSGSPRHDLPPPSSSSSYPATSTLHFISEDPGKFGSEWFVAEDSMPDYLQSTSIPDNYLTKSEDLQSSASDSNFLGGSQPKRRAEHIALERDLRLMKTPLLPPLRGKAGLAVSTPALDQVGVSRRVAAHEMSRSMELGVFKLKKKGRQSLEALTRIGSDEPFSRRRMAPIKRHRSDENAKTVRPSNGDSWAEETVVANAVSSDTFQHSGSQPGRGSSQSTSEGQKTSQEGVGVAPSIATAPARVKTRRVAKSYQSQRPKLHKRSSQKSLPGSLDGEIVGDNRPLRGRRRLTSREEEEERGRRGSKRRSFKAVTSNDHQVQNRVKGQEAEEQPTPSGGYGLPARPTPGPSTRPHTYENVPPLIQATPASPEAALPKRGVFTQELRHPVRQRPASATELSPTLSNYLEHPYPHRRPHEELPSSQRLIQSVEVPARPGASRKIPLYHTRSAQTPFGEQEYTEVPIDEVIRSRQLLSPQSHSLDSGVVVSDRGGEEGEGTGGGHRKRGKNWSIFGGGKSKLLQSRTLTVSDERLFPGRSPSPSNRRLSSDAALTSSTLVPSALSISTTCHGVLHKKQDRGEDGKKSHDRSWRTFFAILSGNKLIFHKDRKDAEMGKPCDEAPIDVVPSSTDVARDYSRKKFVFRVITAQGAEFLLQAEDHESMRRWVSEVQRLNGGSPKPPEMITLAVNRAREPDGGKLAPPSSPTPFRRFSSPTPNKIKKKDKEDGGSRPKLLSKLRKTITRTRDTEGPDSSSFTTFGQPLELCPVSMENKRVPLVVEVCVKEVEEQGLQIEGIYRKAGPGSIVKMISAEMDKGNYSFPDYEDIHVMSSLLKKFLKELPDPLIPGAVYNDFIACGREENEEKRLSRLKELVYHLPTAHYHTLKFIMKHLRKVTTSHDINKMTVRNVALVFGPTLVRNPAHSADLLVSAINAGYTVVELLCRHVELVFLPELCEEEEEEENRFQGQLAAMVDAEKLRTNSEPSISVHELRQQQKDNALLRASPKMLRRIRNDFNSRRSSVEGSKVTAADISLPLQRKQQNVESQPTDTLRSNHSSGSSLPSPGHRSPDAPYAGHTPPHQAKRTVQQSYDEGGGAVVKSSASQRTKHWVNQHNQLGWGVEGSERRETGSLWRTKEVLQAQKEKKDRRLSMTRDQVLTSRSIPGEPVRELLYHGSQDSYHTSRSSTFPTRGASPALVVPRVSTLPASQHQRQAPRRRRVSYMEALGDSSQLQLSEDFLQSERFHGNAHYSRRDTVEDPRRFEATYHHDHRPHHRLARVKSSEDPGEEGRQRRDLGRPHTYGYHGRSHGHYSGATPPTRALHSPQPPMTSKQLESYL